MHKLPQHIFRCEGDDANSSDSKVSILESKYLIISEMTDTMDSSSS